MVDLLTIYLRIECLPPLPCSGLFAMHNQYLSVAWGHHVKLCWFSPPVSLLSPEECHDQHLSSIKSAHLLHLVVIGSSPSWGSGIAPCTVLMGVRVFHQEMNSTQDPLPCAVDLHDDVEAPLCFPQHCSLLPGYELWGHGPSCAARKSWEQVVCWRKRHSWIVVRGTHFVGTRPMWVQ